MPSLVYITRIRPLSAELAQGLESAGFHVRSFAPGEITADGCLLVMTSEAVLSGLSVSAEGLASATGGALAADGEGTARLAEVQKLLGPEAAIWNCIKAAGLSGIAPAKPGRPPAPAPAAEVSAGHLGFVPSQTGQRALAISHQKAVEAASAVPGRRPARAEKTPDPAVNFLPAALAGKTIKDARAGRIHLQKGQRRERFWQPAAMAAALLIFALVLLAGRASILSPDASAGEDANQSSHSTPDAATGSTAGSVHRASMVRSQPGSQASNPGEAAAKVSAGVPAEDRRHISDYDFVAEDYTTHFDLRAHRGSIQTPELRHGARNQTIQKRIVIN